MNKNKKIEKEPTVVGAIFGYAHKQIRKLKKDIYGSAVNTKKSKNKKKK